MTGCISFVVVYMFYALLPSMIISTIFSEFFYFNRGERLISWLVCDILLVLSYFLYEFFIEDKSEKNQINIISKNANNNMPSNEINISMPNDSIQGNPVTNTVKSINLIHSNHFVNPIDEKYIMEMSWRDFEEFIAKVFRDNGYKTIVTPARWDEGKDIIAERNGITYYIECKHWSKENVGRVYLQKLVGAAASADPPVHSMIFITTSCYHDNAIEYCKELNARGEFHLQLMTTKDIINMVNVTSNNNSCDHDIYIGADMMKECPFKYKFEDGIYIFESSILGTSNFVRVVVKEYTNGYGEKEYEIRFSKYKTDMWRYWTSKMGNNTNVVAVNGNYHYILNACANKIGFTTSVNGCYVY